MNQIMFQDDLLEQMGVLPKFFSFGPASSISTSTLPQNPEELLYVPSINLPSDEDQPLILPQPHFQGHPLDFERDSSSTFFNADYFLFN